jgi:hypothetical protein
MILLFCHHLGSFAAAACFVEVATWKITNFNCIYLVIYVYIPETLIIKLKLLARQALRQPRLPIAYESSSFSLILPILKWSVFFILGI